MEKLSLVNKYTLHLSKISIRYFIGVRNFTDIYKKEIKNKGLDVVTNFVGSRRKILATLKQWQQSFPFWVRLTLNCLTF